MYRISMLSDVIVGLTLTSTKDTTHVDIAKEIVPHVECATRRLLRLRRVPPPVVNNLREKCLSLMYISSMATERESFMS